MRLIISTEGPRYVGESAQVKKKPGWSVTLEKLFHTVRSRGLESQLMCGGLLTVSERQSWRPARRRATDATHESRASRYRRAPNASRTDPTPTAGASEMSATSTGLENESAKSAMTQPVAPPTRSTEYVTWKRSAEAARRTETAKPVSRKNGSRLIRTHRRAVMDAMSWPGWGGTST